MAKKKAVKKSTKKNTEKKKVKKTTKKSIAKKSVKKITKKAIKKASKKSAKKITKKQVSKKTTKKSTVNKTTKKVVKKPSSAPKQQVTEKFTPHITSLKAGMHIPYFEGIDQNGNKITSNDLIGRKTIIYFYPKDDTPGCTKEACNLKDNYQKLLDAGYTVIGISADDTESHKKFIEKYNLPFPLIADTDKNIIRAFDVWGKKQFMGKIHEGIIRTTFVIDENGIISNVITKVDVENHAEQILNQ